MSDAPRYATLRDYVRVLRAHRVLIVLAVIAFAGAAYVYSSRQDPTYQAQAKLAFHDPTRDFVLLGSQAPPEFQPQQRAAISAALIKREDIVEGVKKRLKTKLSLDSLKGSVEARAEAQTTLVVIQATAGNRRFAAKLANAYAEEASDAFTHDAKARVNDLVRATLDQVDRIPRKDVFARGVTRDRAERLRTLKSTVAPVQIAVPAVTPEGAISPKPARDTVLGGLIGLTLGLLAAFVRDALDRRLRGFQEISEEMKLPLLGHVSAQALGRAGFVGNGSGTLAPADLEAFRILRRNLEFLDIDRPVRCIAVTSALPEEGKSTVAASLASAQALAGRRALLVECDLRRPSLAGRLGLQHTPGLTDYLIGEAEPSQVLQTVSLEGSTTANGADPSKSAVQGPQSLICITAGSRVPRPAELLASQRFKAFIENVRDAYDVVVIDTSPLLSVADTLELLPYADGVLVCIRSARTTREQARAAKATLEHLPARPTGVVVTGLRPGDYDDYGYYSYGYES